MRFNNNTIITCLFFCLIVLTISGCSEDIQVIEPGSPVPVVYAVFDVNQSVHYVKVSKTFVGESDPYTLAKNHDQIFYPDAKVFVADINGNGHVQFSLVTDIPRLPGSFPELPNEVFELRQKLNPGDYRLTVILPSEKDTLTALFSFINTFRVITPKAGFKRFYLYEDPMLFSWYADPAAGLYEISLSLTYEEWMKTGTMQSHIATFTRQIKPSDLESEKDYFNYRFYSDSFFAHLGTSIALNPAVDYRKPVGLELLITAADTTLARYLNWFNLEIDDKVNPNGNVTGAIGVAGTKYSVPYPGLILSGRSQDSLVRGRYTKKLDFVNNPDW